MNRRRLLYLTLVSFALVSWRYWERYRPAAEAEREASHQRQGPAPARVSEVVPSSAESTSFQGQKFRSN